MSILIRSKVNSAAQISGSLDVKRIRDAESVLPSHKVDQQFPEFIRSDYPNMVEFARTYLKFVETTENGKIAGIKDIDKTSFEYINALRKEFSYNSTKFDFLEDREFIRISKLFYSTKGTEESIKFIFRALYGQEVDVWYPSERMFKTSSARWFQEKSIKVTINADTSLPATSFVGKYLQLQNSVGQKQLIEVTKVKDITVKSSPSDPSEDFEIFFTTELFIPISYNDVITGDEFLGTILPSLSSVKVISPGNGFRVGQTIKLDSIVGSGAVAVVTAILPDGGIRSLKLLTFGTGYTSSFYVTVNSNSLGGYGQTSGEGVPLEDFFPGYKERTTIFRSDYVLNDSPEENPLYVLPGYDGNVVADVIETQVESLELEGAATLLCEVSAFCLYPGKFLDEVGMPSNISVLQDNDLYQEFSYVIQSRAL